MRALLLLAVFAVAVPVRPDIAPKEERPPECQLLGHWQLVKIMLGDMVLPEETEGSFVTFTRTEILTTKKGERSPDDDALYIIDWSKKPATIDLTPKEKGEKAVVGIVKVEGDRLTICFAVNPTGPRPDDFAARPASLIGMLELKRMTK